MKVTERGRVEQLSHAAGEVARSEWLLQASHSGVHGLVRGPGRREDSNAGPQRREARHDFPAPALRQRDAGQHQVDRAGTPLGKVQGRLPAGGLDDRVAVVLQHLARQAAQPPLVLEKQERLRAAGVLEGRGRGPTAEFRLLLDPRQTDLEHGPAPRLAVDPDEAAALFHDAVDGREAEAGALPLSPSS